MDLPLELMRCPDCGGRFSDDASCPACDLRPTRRGSVLDYLATPERVPEPEVNAFYEDRPFPGYADGDDATSLLDRARTSPFLVGLDAAIPADATVLDAGCGTGQLSAFLSLAGRRRRIIGADACAASLAAADGFRARASIDNLQLLRGDLFSLPLAEDAFDVVNCRGVIHHTPDPDRALARVARHVRPGGFLVLGFYESIARLPHRMRRGLANVAGRPVRFLDPILRRSDLSEDKKLTWIEDQYRHPLEHCLPFTGVLRAAKQVGLQWIRSVPDVPERDTFFDATPEPSTFGLFARRVGWALSLGDEDAGLVCLVVRRPAR